MSRVPPPGPLPADRRAERRPGPRTARQPGRHGGLRAAGRSLLVGWIVALTALLGSGCAGAVTEGTTADPAGPGPATSDGVPVAGGGVGVTGDGAETDPDLLPPGYGTLRQDEITLSLRSEDLLIKVTPLDPAVIRVLASDTWQRLRGLREGNRPELVRRSGASDPDLFLVSFFSYEQQVPYEPEDVHLLNRGLRYRPLGIGPVTPGWGRQRLAQEETQMAIYAFGPGLDLNQELTAEYQDARVGGWERILQRIQAERSRILARARSMP